MKLKDAIARYLVEIMPEKRDSTRLGSNHHYKFWWDELGDLELEEVKAQHLLLARDKLLREKTAHDKLRTRPTVNRYFASLSHVYAVANQEWLMDVPNPVQRIKRYKEARGRVRYLDGDELARLLRACKESRNRELYDAVVLLIATGCRRGEILDLTWPQVDLDRRCINLSPEQQKNGQHSSVPLVGAAFAILSSKPKKGFRVFESRRMRTAWVEAVKRAKIDDLRMHDLRHSLASYMTMSGASDRVVQEVLRHQSASMTKRYSHLRLEDSARALDKAYAQFLAPAIAQQG